MLGRPVFPAARAAIAVAINMLIAEAQLAAIKLRSWTEGGIYAKLFDRRTSMRLDSDWLFFNVEGLSSDPRLEMPALMLFKYGKQRGYLLDWLLFHTKPHVYSALERDRELDREYIKD
jgi:hypothetical protein